MLKLSGSDIKVLLHSEDITSEEKNIIKKSKSFLGLFGGEFDDTKYSELAQKIKDITNPDINKIMNEVKENNKVNPPKMYQDAEKSKGDESLNKEINTFSIKAGINETEEKKDEVSTATEVTPETTYENTPEEKVKEEPKVEEKHKMVFVAPSGTTTEIKTEAEKAEEERIAKLDKETIKAPNIEQVAPPKSNIDLDKVETETPKEIKKPEIDQVVPPKSALLQAVEKEQTTEIKLDETTEEKGDAPTPTKGETKIEKNPNKIEFVVKNIQVQEKEKTEETLETPSTEKPIEEKVSFEEPLIPNSFSFGKKEVKEETPEEIVKEIEETFDLEEENEKLFKRIDAAREKVSNINAPQKIHTINLLEDTLSVIKVNLSLEITEEERNLTIKTLKEVEEEIDMINHI
ncbi:MAG: hypothetical protein N4A44_04085 [Alphaproteobacteria bacterium]|jgi:hypothetical protein|nr:hypothetical protein [Alphaproteobacteria bacterium]